MFKKMLKQYREESKINKVELAALCGLTKSYISNLENGKIQPPPHETCKRIADALSLNANERRKFFEAAFLERNENKDSDYKHVLGMMGNILADKRAMTFSELDEPPFIEWKSLSSLPQDQGGIMLYQTRIVSDDMQPESKKGEIIHFQTSEKPVDGKYVIAVGAGGSAILRLYRKYGSQVVLRAINSNLPEIPVNRDNHYEFIGVVKKAMNIREY